MLFCEISIAEPRPTPTTFSFLHFILHEMNPSLLIQSLSMLRRLGQNIVNDRLSFINFVEAQ